MKIDWESARLSIGFILGLYLLAFASYKHRKLSSREISENMKPINIMRHSVSLYSSLALFVATKLDIFSFLDNGPLTVKEVASALETRPHFVEGLLDALVTAELLEVDGQRFANTPEASHYLVKGKHDYIGERLAVDSFLKYWAFEVGALTGEVFKPGKGAANFDYTELNVDALLSTFRETMPVTVEAGEAFA